jgi:hypothetical protein
MKRYKFYLIVFFTIISVISCTKVIDLKLGNNTGKLVIEGNITNVSGSQFIKLSQNVPFTSTNTYPPVTGAIVSVSDSIGNIFPFTEGPPGIYSSSPILGNTGNAYKMSVLTGGVSYTARSVMPALVPLDSITSKIGGFNGSNNLREITVHFQDPAGVANQYRFILSVNGVQANDIFVINDEFFDGRYVDYDLVENDINIHPGNIVTVEMQCIDKPIYTYWFTLMQQAFNGPGGVAPSNPPTNITPASLGYFSAHTTQSITLLVK